MVNYNCIRCGYTTNDKAKMKLHFNRKTPCKPKINNINIDEYKERILNGEKFLEISSVNPGKSSVNPGKSSVNPGKSSVNPGKNDNNKERIGYGKKMSVNNNINYTCNNIKKELICKYCNKIFQRKDYLESHLKKSCKMLKEFNNIYNFNKNTFGNFIYKGYKNTGDIYIIQTDYLNNNNYKIGITNNIQKRLSQYRCSNIYEPRLHYYISCQDIKVIDDVLSKELMKYNVKSEIFQGDINFLVNIITKLLKKEFNISKVFVHEPEIKICNLSECQHCNKCFYSKTDLFEHFNSCEEYKESLAKGKKYECEYCKKKYSTNFLMNIHLEKCKDKIKDDEEKKTLLNLVDMLNKQLKEQNEEHKKQLSEQNKQITELIKKAGIQNSNITNNIQNNIKILAYKNTDLSHLTDNDYIYCLNRSNMVIPNLIKKIHFNPKKPENHNIYISNIKNKYIMTYDGNKWNVNNQNETIDNLIDTNEIVIEQKLEEWLENGNEYPEIMKKFNRYLEKKEKDEVKNTIKEEIRLMLFNNRKMISII